jgi:hypothetical protein
VAWSWAMTRVPWKTILMHAPTIVEAARSLYGPPRKTADDAGPEDRAPGGIERLRQRVEILEQRDAQQAALFADLARQVQEMATALEVLRVRIQLTMVGTAVAVVLSVLSAAFVLWRGR